MNYKSKCVRPEARDIPMVFGTSWYIAKPTDKLTLARKETYMSVLLNQSCSAEQLGRYYRMLECMPVF